MFVTICILPVVLLLVGTLLGTVECNVEINRWRAPILHGAYATNAIWLLLEATPNRDALPGLTLATWLITQLSARFTILTQKQLLICTLLKCANTEVLIKFWRLATIVRALPLFIGRSSLHKRFVLDVSARLDALRQTGKLIETPGTWTEFTMLLLALSKCRHLALPESVELPPLLLAVFVFAESELELLSELDRPPPHNLVSGLLVLLTIGRFDLVRCPPHVLVVVNVLLVRGHG